MPPALLPALRAGFAVADRRIARPLDRAARAARRRLEALRRAALARRLLREMQAWPNERLRDIGLARTELAEAVLGAGRCYRWVPESQRPPLEPARFGY